MNPILIAAGGASLLALLLLGPGKAKAAGTTDPTRRPPNTTPVKAPEAQAVRVSICEAAAKMPGTILTEPLAAAVWASIYPAAPWPTRTDDHASVLAAETVLRSEIAKFIANPESYCAAAGDGTIKLSDVETTDRPQPGYHYQVKQGQIVNGGSPGRLVYDALMSGGTAAALEAGADQAQAQAFGKALASNPQARARYRNLLYCDIFNDMYMGTYGFDADYGAAGPNGRRFRNLPQHEDNRTRIAMGLSPMRRTPIMTPADSGKGNANAKMGKLPYLHFPLLDYDKLMQADLPIDARLVYGTYNDGSSGALPPPQVQRIMSTIGLPDIQWGCSGPGYVLYEG